MPDYPFFNFVLRCPWGDESNRILGTTARSRSSGSKRRNIRHRFNTDFIRLHSGPGDTEALNFTHTFKIFNVYTNDRKIQETITLCSFYSL